MADNIKLRLGTNQDLTLYHYGNDAYIDNADGDIIFRQGTSEKVRINSAGSIGINTTNPDMKLEVYNGGIKIDRRDAADTSNPHLSMRTGANGSSRLMIYAEDHTDDNSNWIYKTNSSEEHIFHIGSTERLRIASAGQIGLSGTNYGTAGQVLTSGGPSAAPSWSGGSTRVLEYISAPCTGESVDTSYGTRTTVNAGTAGYQLTTSYVDLVGSQITYRPPTGTHTVIYKFSFCVSNQDADGISHFKFYVGGAEVVYARYTVRADDFQNRVVFEWPIRIGGTQDMNHGRLASWNGDYEMKMQAREYNATYEMKVHMTNNWDGAGTDQFSMPTISITALGT